MFKKMKHMKNEKGLTLIELLAVIVILAIVAAIAIPSIGNIINNQRDKAVLADASGIISAAKIVYVDGGCNVSTETGATATNCEKSELSEFVTSDKFTTYSVDMSNPKNPVLTITLNEALKTEKVSNMILKYDTTATKINSKVKAFLISEQNLNNVMGN